MQVGAGVGWLLAERDGWSCAGKCWKAARRVVRVNVWMLNA